MALFVGSQVSETQAKLEHLGIGEDPREMDRYSSGRARSICAERPHPWIHRRDHGRKSWQRPKQGTGCWRTVWWTLRGECMDSLKRILADAKATP